jgi:DHA2 family multidrug resistance protein
VSATGVRSEIAASGNARRGDAVALRDWIAVLGGVLGAFMAILDIMITNASLADIQGSLGASLDEGSWVSTGYLISEVVVIPLTGWLSRVFGLRRYLLANCAAFLVFSVLCGRAANLTEMIVFRVGQGFSGGVLIPLAFTILLVKLPLSKRAIGGAMFGFTATFAPAIGPTLGGWLTDNWSWQWIFYINVLPGILMITMIAYGLDWEPPQLWRLKSGDYLGVVCMAIGLGSLIYVLEEGQRKDWFGNDTIRMFAWLAGIFLVAFIAIQFTRKEPLLDLRLLRRRALGVATAMNIGTGLGLYGTTFIMPLYLAQVQGYNALEIGHVMMWLGLPQLAMFPLVPLILKYIDSRLVVGFGLAMFATSCLMNGYMSHDSGIDQLKWAQLVRALGQPMIMAPLSAMATVGIQPSQAGSASAVFNMFRNLGGSVGIAMMAVIATRREHYHFSIIAERVTHNAAHTHEMLDQLMTTYALHGGEAQMQATAQLARIVRREAMTMAYADAFTLIGIGLTVAMVGVFFLPPLPRFSTPDSGR